MMFFFKQKTAYEMRIIDWSSDVCSSDLYELIGLASFLGFVREHKEIYRIIDEAEFVDYASYRRHYETTVERIRQRLEAGAVRGEIRSDVGEIHAWAIGGMNVFLGMRYGLWDADADIEAVAAIADRKRVA